MLLKKSDFPPLQWHVLKSLKNRQFLTSAGQCYTQSNIKYQIGVEGKITLSMILYKLWQVFCVCVLILEMWTLHYKMLKDVNISIINIRDELWYRKNIHFLVVWSFDYNLASYL